MPETGQGYTPENPTLEDTQEQPALVETLPPQDYVDTAAEGNKEDTIGETIRGASGWNNMDNLDNLKAINGQVQTPEAQSSDLVPDATALVLPEMTPEERAAKAEFIDDLSHEILYPNDPEYNQEQLENIKVMDGLLKNYPHAFTKGSTDDGRKYLLLKKGTPTKQSIKTNDFSRYEYGNGGLMFSNKGMLDFTRSIPGSVQKQIANGDFDLTPILDAQSDTEDITIHKYDDGEWYKFRNEQLKYPDIRLHELKAIILNAEEAHKNDVEKKDLTAEDILKDLL